jgi:small nuclear ribonucleoprotein (snRNP)-like protein
MSFQRPLDFLDRCKNKPVIITLKNKEAISGILKVFDIHINIVIEVDKTHKFIRGDEIFSIDENE